MSTLTHITVFIIGFVVVSATVLSAVKTFVLPRSVPDRLTGLVFRSLRWVFELRLKGMRDYNSRDRIMAFYAPISLLVLLPVWLSLVTLGYAGMYWGAGIESWYQALRISGSSLLTLGYSSGQGMPYLFLELTEATLGLMLVALLIAYLPSMYSAFSKREAAVTLLEVRAGNPPSAVEMIQRYYRNQGLIQLAEQWQTWETWFTDIEESHTSLAALVFFRSPHPDRSWVTASGAVLDAAAISLSSLDLPYEPRAALCIRAGFIALRRIAEYFRLPYHPNPHYPAQTISITREQFDEALDLLAASGVPLKPDRDQAWIDFAGWRVNYDQVLLALADLTMAPEAPWTGQRNFNKNPNQIS